MPSHPWLTCIALMVLLRAAPAPGQDLPGPTPDLQPEFGEESAVEGRAPGAVGSNDTASAGSFTQRLIVNSPLLRPGEVVELVPGLVTTQHSGGGKANQYFLRGFDLDHGTDFLTTLDGMPLNMRTHAHGQGYTDLNLLIPELVERVEYFKGPYFASKGDFASAGAADISYAESLPANRVWLTGGPHLYGRTLLAGSPELADGHLLYGLELLHDDGPWKSPDRYRRLNGVVRLTQGTDERKWSLTAMAYDGAWDATDQVPLRAVAGGQLDRFGAVDASDGGSSQRFSLSGSYQRGLGPGLLEANAYAVRYHLDLFSDFTYFLRDPVHGDQFEQSENRWVLGTSGRWTWAGAVGAIPLRLVTGWEGRWDRIDPVGLYDTAARLRLRAVRQDVVRETSAGAFTQGDARWAPWLRTVVGVRYDQFLFQVASDRLENSGRRSAGRASPKVSVVLGPWGRTEAFVNAGLGFHSNDARGVTTTVDPRSGGPASPVTPLAGTRGAEVGVHTEVIPALDSSLALWRLDVDSELILAGDTGGTEPSRPSRREGVEWSTRWRSLRWLRFDLDVVASRARFTQHDSAGDHIPGAIASAVSAAATIHRVGPWSASLTFHHFGSRPLTEDGSVRSAPSTRLDAQVGCKLAAQAMLSVEVFNLLDAASDEIAYFYTSRLSGEPAAGVSDVHVHPAQGRAVRLSASFGF